MFESKEEAEDMMSIFNKKETLDPELQMYFDNSGGFPMIRHPLVYSIMHTDQQNAYVNKQLKVKQAAAEKYLKEKKFSSFVFLHERPYRVQAFQEIEDDLSDSEYWKLLGEIWIDSENIWQTPQWRKLLGSKRGDSHAFMDDEDREEFEKLPEELTIYRGYTKGKNEKGFSYTIDKKKAEWFATRFGGNKNDVITKTVKKSDCFAYLGGRGEKEIVYLGK